MSDVVMKYEPGKAPLVKGLSPTLPERGKIKIGMKGDNTTSSKGKDYQSPKKLKHFIVTTLERGKDDNFIRDESIHKIIGDEPKRIPIMLMYNDVALNFQSRFVAFSGKTLWCSGDGEFAWRIGENGEQQKRKCPCEHYTDMSGKISPQCKLTGRLSCIIRGAEVVGGVWKFRTTSFNSVNSITASLAFIYHVTGGVLAGIPLDLVVGPKTVTVPSTGRQQTIQVVSVEFPGGIESLREKSYERLLNTQEYHHRVKMIEARAAENISAEINEDEIEDITAEFYPAEAAKAEGKEYRDPDKAPPLVEEEEEERSGEEAETGPGEEGATWQDVEKEADNGVIDAPKNEPDNLEQESLF